MEERDLVVVGGGPAGYVAAIRACQLGGKVALIEKDALGGTCLNRGCIPTRTLARGVELLDLAKKAKDYGVSFGEASVDFAKMMARKDIVIKTLVGGVDLLLKGNGVEVVKGRGKFLSSSEVEVELEGGEKKVIKARGIIIATGSGTRRLSVPGGNGKGIIASEEALELSEVPKSMVILGGQ
ncbi:MAG: FAD-dependent oxidoreductase, partial [Dehalococcoidia bacterium]